MAETKANKRRSRALSVAQRDAQVAAERAEQLQREPVPKREATYPVGLGGNTVSETIRVARDVQAVDPVKRAARLLERRDVGIG